MNAATNDQHLWTATIRAIYTLALSRGRRKGI